MEEGIVIGSPKQALWTDIKRQAEGELEQAERNYFRVKEFQQAVIEMATKKLEELGFPQEIKGI